MADQIANGGVEAFLHYLLDIDLTEFNPRQLPETKALRQQRFETMMHSNPTDAWLCQVLSDGEFAVEGGAYPWVEEVSAYAIQASFKEATSANRLRCSWDIAAKRLRKLLPPGAFVKRRKVDNGFRSFSYVLPDLDDARRYFTKVTGVDPCAT